MHAIAKRGIFGLGRRMQGKRMKRQSDNVNNFQRDDYINTMKQLQMETRGMLQDSFEYKQIHNRLFTAMGQRKAAADEKFRKTQSN